MGRFVLIVLGLGVIFVVIANIAAPPDLPVSERAKRECAKMHPYDEIQANNCSIALMVRYMDENRKSQMDGAYQRIR